MTTAHPMTDTQIHALAAFIANDSDSHWHYAGTVTALRARRDHVDAWTLAIAAIRAAADPKNRTPAVLHYDNNRCWQDTPPTCTIHGQTQRRPDGECAGCYADRTGRTDDDTQAAPLGEAACPASERTLGP